MPIHIIRERSYFDNFNVWREVDVNLGICNLISKSLYL